MGKVIKFPSKSVERRIKIVTEGLNEADVQKAIAKSVIADLTEVQKDAILAEFDGDYDEDQEES